MRRIAGGRQHGDFAIANFYFGGAADDDFVFSIANFGGEKKAAGAFIFSRDFDAGLDALADEDRFAKGEILAEIESVFAGNVHANELRKKRREQDAVNDATAKFGGAGVFGVDVQGAVVAAEAREMIDIFLREGTLDGIGFADRELAKGPFACCWKGFSHLVVWS